MNVDIDGENNIDIQYSRKELIRMINGGILERPKIRAGLRGEE